MHMLCVLVGVVFRAELENCRIKNIGVSKKDSRRQRPAPNDMKRR